MTKQEVVKEFTLRLLAVVDLCDKEIQAAYEKRQQALIKLNGWLSEAYKEATDGD